MRFFANALFCLIAFLLFFTFPGWPEPQEKREGPAYRSVFIGEDDNLRIEITSAVFVKESKTDDASKTYTYSCFIKNGSKTKVKLKLSSFPDRFGFSPKVLELEAGISVLATIESKAVPKVVQASQEVAIFDDAGRWVTKGLGLSFIYVPDVPSEEKKKGSSGVI